ncbi:hypothetical protein NF556_03450 [Ornithinimicrobium faecis]|uniref:Lipoprotein n=1 Tax=Ornithinimicrobium faecis TaxID=2934158 RepID=A0ABY4YX88_9MICO|nr:hypothetical protein [Ornithinimicrobium sp. HY1793]USQ80727.1 hypothetical protein NF556_03450 [Ornithinimicrobium sp. HY1793]
MELTEGRDRWWSVGLLVIALLVTVAACGTGGGAQAGDPGATTGPGEDKVVAVHDEVRFYPACGNEVLRYEGLELYMLLPEEDIETLRLGHGTSVQAPVVAPPGPGEDVGTLTVYGDGYARFVSDNGEFDVWLTPEHRDYNWVC